ncbi:hypothetical protein niasHS_010145 [Heterodera schachtii]|uniref:39S ribosomal protein L52, mitochondrial n=1 Tax=Heterodera schachtii TaxID=97005 RepID=A0ABD2J4J1_HETSC
MNSTSSSYRIGPQWWKKPIYQSPVVNPLERGPDFSFVDGRRLPFTTESEFNRRVKQVELGRKVVQYLAEIRHAEELCKENNLQREIVQQKIEQNMPKQKGTEELF